MSRAQLTVTVSPELGLFVAETANEQSLKKSGVVERALEHYRQHLKDELLKEGYLEMAEHNRALLREFEEAGL